MTIETLVKNLELDILTGESLLKKQVNGCYIGDLLSWVMSKAQENNVWITVMGNVNAIAVAVLTDVPCIILAESSALDSEAKERAAQNNIVVLRSNKNSYELAVCINKLYCDEKNL